MIYKMQKRGFQSTEIPFSFYKGEKYAEETAGVPSGGDLRDRARRMHE